MIDSIEIKDSRTNDTLLTIRQEHARYGVKVKVKVIKKFVKNNLSSACYIRHNELMSELSLTRQCDVANNISDSNISDINVNDIKIRVRSWKCNCWNNLKRKFILLVSVVSLKG